MISVVMRNSENSIALIEGTGETVLIDTKNNKQYSDFSYLETAVDELKQRGYTIIHQIKVNHI